MRPVTAVAVLRNGHRRGAGIRACGPPEPECQVFSAPIVTSFFVDGCASPFGICTAGSIDGGLLGGSTTFAVNRHPARRLRRPAPVRRRAGDHHAERRC